MTDTTYVVPTPTDPTLFLSDAAYSFAPTGGGTQTGYGTVSGKSHVYDTGSSTATWNGMAVFNTTAIKRSVGDESYIYTIVGATGMTTDGSGNETLTGTTATLAIWPSGTAEQDLANVSNLNNGTIYRYLALIIQAAGTLPSVTVEAFLLPMNSWAGYTAQQLLSMHVLMLQNMTNVITNLRAWMTGPAGGGTNNNGEYPLTDGNGVSVLVESPQQIKADAISSGVVGSSPSDFANKVWTADFESTGLSLAERLTGSLITVGYDGKHPAVADDDTYLYNGEALQAALDRGGVVQLPGPGAKIYLKDRLIYRPAWSTIEGNGSRLVIDNDALFTDPSTLPNLMPSPVTIIPGTLSNYNIWRLNGTNLQLVPVGPNLVPDPTLVDVSQYLQTSSGPNGLTTYTKSSTDPAQGSYSTTDINGVVTVHPVQVMSASATASGTAQFGECCLVDAATKSNLQAFPVTGGKRYAFGVMQRLKTGCATGLQVSAYFSDASGNGLGGGSSAGLTVNGTSPDGHTFTIVDAPSTAATATIIVDVEKDPTQTGPALVAFDNWFFRQIDSACDICPNYIDATTNDGDYADVGIAISEIISFPLEDGVTPNTYQSGARPMRYKVTFNVTAIEQVGTQNYLTVALRQGIGVGSGSAVLSVSETGTVTWESAAPTDINAVTGGYLTFQSSNGVTIDVSSIVVKVVPDNWIILVQADPSDAAFDQAVQSIRNLYIDGPNLEWAEGICFDTPSTLSQASRGNLHNVQIFGCGTPTLYRTQAYLIFDIGVTKIGLDCAERGIPSANAGEQINSLFPVYSGGRVVIDNCFERRIFGGSSDYPTQHQFATTTNTLETWGHHYEGDRPELDSEIPFTVGAGGAQRMHGGKIEHSGKNQNLAAVMPVMFRTTDKFARVDLNYVEASNWQTATGFLADGPGRVHVRNTRGGDTRNISCFVKDDATHNKFGQGGYCEGPAVSIPMWLDGGDVRVNKLEVQYSGLPDSFWKAEMTTDAAYQGTSSIKLTKSGVGVGAPATAYFWFRIPDVGTPAVMLYFKQIATIGGSGTAPIFFDAYSVQLLDTDIPGVYQLGDGWQDGYFGELDYEVDLTAPMTSWVKFQADGSRADKLIAFDGLTREGDNAVLVTLSAVSLPSGAEICVDYFNGAII